MSRELDRPSIIKEVEDQRIYFYPLEGRPSATPSVSIKDKHGSTITAASTTNVTLSAVNTTVATGNSVGDSSLILTAITSIVVRGSYLITNTFLQKEWVRVYKINTSTKEVEFDEPLEYAHAATSTFVGTEFYRTLQAGEVDTLEELYRARASYVVDSLNYVAEVFFDVVLTNLASPLSVEFIKRFRADVMRQQPDETAGDDLQDYRKGAWQIVKAGIRDYKEGWSPAKLRTTEDVMQWALAEFDYLCQYNGIHVIADGEQLDILRYLEEKIAIEKGNALETLEYMDLNEDDSLGSDEVRPSRMDLSR